MECRTRELPEQPPEKRSGRRPGFGSAPADSIVWASKASEQKSVALLGGHAPDVEAELLARQMAGYVIGLGFAHGRQRCDLE